MTFIIAFIRSDLVVVGVKTALSLNYCCCVISFNCPFVENVSIHDIRSQAGGATSKRKRIQKIL